MCVYIYIYIHTCIHTCIIHVQVSHKPSSGHLFLEHPVPRGRRCDASGKWWPSRRTSRANLSLSLYIYIYILSCYIIHIYIYITILIMNNNNNNDISLSSPWTMFAPGSLRQMSSHQSNRHRNLKAFEEHLQNMFCLVSLQSNIYITFWG